ncbi:ABC transporter permease subunit, partial [Akkermansia sp.]|uniref:ABC transporter permease subunit n=1 Tax=Akkermansia sp. TaxID=1872421 RepID=UPI0025C1718A
MSPVLTIFRKALRSYVMTPYGWVILAFVMALQSVSLSGTLKAFQLAPQKEGILFFILHSPMFWFYFLFIFPLLTMRSLAEEEKTGTLESLLTTPIKTWQVVLGKYFSAYAFYIILWLPMLLYPLLADWSNLIVQWIYGYDAGMVLPYRLADWAGVYAILLLVGAWFTAIGIFASSLTGSQIISGIITIGLLVLIFFMGLIPVVWGEFPAAGIFHYMSCSEHLDRFSAGLVDTRPVVFYLTMTVLT